jgi:hypothetical protein
VHRRVHAAVARELGQPEREPGVRDDVRRRVVREPEGLEPRLQPVAEAVAVARVQLRSRNPFRRILRVEVEREPRRRRAEPVAEPLGRRLADAAERSDVVRPDQDLVLSHVFDGDAPKCGE